MLALSLIRLTRQESQVTEAVKGISKDQIKKLNRTPHVLVQLVERHLLLAIRTQRHLYPSSVRRRARHVVASDLHRGSGSLGFSLRLSSAGSFFGPFTDPLCFVTLLGRRRGVEDGSVHDHVDIWWQRYLGWLY